MTLTWHTQMQMVIYTNDSHFSIILNRAFFSEIKMRRFRRLQILKINLLLGILSYKGKGM